MSEQTYTVDLDMVMKVRAKSPLHAQRLAVEIAARQGFFVELATVRPEGAEK